MIDPIGIILQHVCVLYALHDKDKHMIHAEMRKLENSSVVRHEILKCSLCDEVIPHKPDKQTDETREKAVGDLT